MSGRKTKSNLAEKKPTRTLSKMLKQVRLQHILVILTFVLLIGLALFYVITVNNVATDTAISSYQDTELEVVREAARAIQEYVYVQTEVLGRSDISAIEQEIFIKFIAPIHLLSNGDAWIYAPDHVVFDQSEDFPDEYRGKSMAEIFVLQEQSGASHFEEMTTDVSIAKEGVGYYIWLPEKGPEIAAWSPVRVGNYTWTIGLSTPLSEILAATSAPSQIALSTTVILISIVIGLILLVIWLFSDVRRRRAEEALGKEKATIESILASLPGIFYMFYMFDQHGRFLRWNKNLETLTGYSEEEVKEMRPQDFLAEPGKSQITTAMEKAFSEGYAESECTVVTKNGREIPFFFSVNSKQIDGEPFILGMGLDITGRKKAEEALQEANKKLNLLSSITRHDIINQVSAALMFVEVMELEGDVPADSKAAEDLKTIEGALETIERQIVFTRDYQDLGIQSPKWCEVGDIVETVASSRSTSLKVENTVKNLEIYADPLFEKVIYNLFDNAVRHGEKITTIRFFSEQTQGCLKLICEDDGVGVPTEVKEKIFNRQYFKNTGLGLFLSQEILSITGMTITETGVPGVGARFEISVPDGMWRSV